jgi:asparagine synthase (glutamine-hydrolysing)
MARNMSEPVKTFSVGFAEAGEDNELADAQLVADAFGTDHHPIELSFAEQSIELDEFAWWLDEPVADLGALGFLALSKLASSHVTVALSGQGADELLAGYSRYWRAAAAGHANRLPSPIRKAGELMLRQAGGRYAQFADAIAARGPAERQLALRGQWLTLDRQRELARGGLAEVGTGAALRAIERHAVGLHDDPLAASLYLDSQLTLVDDMIHYFDRASMAYSLEVRVPFLDHHVVELCSTIPGRYKLRGTHTKRLLKQVARGLVPDNAIDKRKTGFFSGVARSWMREQLRGPAADYLLREDMACGEFLDAAELRKMVKNTETGPARDVDSLFAVLMLEVWLSSVLPKACAPSESPRELIEVSA